MFVIDIEDINVDFEKKLVNFKPGLINNEILKSVKNSKTVCVINKIDKINEKKFPEEVCEMKCSFENFKWFIFISCKEQKNINSLIFCLQKQVILMFLLNFFIGGSLFLYYLLTFIKIFS